MVTEVLDSPVGGDLTLSLKVMQMKNEYYSIGETARLTGLSVKAIRHYAIENIVAPSMVSESGYRLYDANALWRLALVRQLRKMEFTLPLIRNILNHSPDIPAVIRWQKEALDLQIRHLTKVRSQLEQIPLDEAGESSLAHLHMILEVISMSNDEKQEWLTDRWQRAMVPEEAPEDWKTAFMEQLKDSLPAEWTTEQTKAWAELQEFLDDPVYRDQLQEAVRPFWQMIQQRDMEPNEWNQSMERLMDRASTAYRAGYSAADPEVQSIVDEWIHLFSQALQMPVNETFMERFSQYAETSSVGPSRRLWDIMSRINPEKMSNSFEAQDLLLEGLRWRQQSSK